MRDPELMLSLLREMANDSMGRIAIVLAMGMSPSQQMRYHNMELLVDIGHAEWVNERKSRARITNDGWEFIKAIDQSPETKQTFLNLLEQKGLTYLDVVTKVMNLWSRIGSG